LMCSADFPCKLAMVPLDLAPLFQFGGSVVEDGMM